MTGQNGFERCNQVEAEAIGLLMPLAMEQGMQLIPTSGQTYLQKFYGDYVVRYRNQKIKFVEVKAEQRNPHGNLFIETWSNGLRFTPGWFWTCQADTVWYVFLEERILYSFDFPSMKEWLGRDEVSNKYRHITQQKTKQKNDTWGWLVPIEDASQNVKDWKEVNLA